MKIGDVIFIKNQAGLLAVHIAKELCLEDITKGIGGDKLPGFSKPRLEYHKGPFGNHLITYCGDLTDIPFNMYIMHIDECEDKPSCYLGVCNDAEQSMFYETKY